MPKTTITKREIKTQTRAFTNATGGELAREGKEPTQLASSSFLWAPNPTYFRLLSRNLVSGFHFLLCFPSTWQHFTFHGDELITCLPVPLDKTLKCKESSVFIFLFLVSNRMPDTQQTTRFSVINVALVQNIHKTEGIQACRWKLLFCSCTTATPLSPESSPGLHISPTIKVPTGPALIPKYPSNPSQEALSIQTIVIPHLQQPLVYYSHLSICLSFCHHGEHMSLCGP